MPKKSEDTPAPDAPAVGTVTLLIDGKESSFKNTPGDSPRLNFFRKSSDKGVFIQRFADDLKTYVQISFIYDLEKGGFPKEITEEKFIKYHRHSDDAYFVSQPQDVVIKVTSYKDNVVTGTYSGTLKEETKGTKITISGSFSAKLSEL